MRSYRWWWIVYFSATALVIAAMLWVSRVALELERAKGAARHEVRLQELVRLARSRMDAWLLPILANETARPYYEYQAYYPSTPDKNTDTDLATLSPSPLLAQEQPSIRIHFEVGADGHLSSPQVPLGSQAVRRIPRLCSRNDRESQPAAT